MVVDGALGQEVVEGACPIGGRIGPDINPARKMVREYKDLVASG
jgi:hypothetical protein